MRLLLLLFCLLVCGCGQKGDLYLPDTATPESIEPQSEDAKDAKDAKENKS